MELGALLMRTLHWKRVTALLSRLEIGCEKLTWLYA